jgi:hypothetical protein
MVAASAMGRFDPGRFDRRKGGGGCTSLDSPGVAAGQVHDRVTEVGVYGAGSTAPEEAQ